MTIQMVCARARHGSLLRRPEHGSTLERSEHGSTSVELALVVPALVLLLCLMVAGGRLWFDRATVALAAESAARAASLARSAGQGAADGQRAARQSLATAGLKCASQSVSIDTSAFSVPVGTPATITSSVTCVVTFADIALPGLPRAITVVSSGSSALDTYRSRR